MKYIKTFNSINEAKFNKNKLMKAMKKDDGMIQLGNGTEYVIYAFNNGNDDNDAMWGDKTIFALDQDGEEHEVKYSDIVKYDESTVNEAFKFNEKQVKDVADKIAQALAVMDKIKTEVHDIEFDKGRGAGFEISMDGEKYEGGSYTVRPNGDVVNSAIGNSFPNAVYAKIGDTDIKKIIKNIKKYNSFNKI
jgi:hypothetical protein